MPLSLTSQARAEQASTTHSCFTHILIKTIWATRHTFLVLMFWTFFLSQHYIRYSGSSWLADHSISSHPTPSTIGAAWKDTSRRRHIAKFHHAAKISKPLFHKILEMPLGVTGEDGRIDRRKEHSRVLFWSGGGNIDLGRGASSTLTCLYCKRTGYLKNRSERKTEKMPLSQLTKFNTWQTAIPKMSGRKMKEKISCPLATLALNVAPKSRDSSVWVSQKYPQCSRSKTAWVLKS